MANVTGTQIIAKAKEFVGENGTRFWNDYGWSGVAWCVMFIWDIFRMCGASNLFYDGKKVAGCGLEYTWCKKNLSSVSLANAKAGDIVIFGWKKGEISHTGFAIRPLSSTVLETIEGNTSGGRVAIRQRGKQYILGIFRPKYASPAPAPSPSNEAAISKTYRVISKKGMNVRTLPKYGTTIVGVVAFNSTFKATKKSGDWVYSPSMKGWVCEKDASNIYLTAVASASYRKTFKAVTKLGSNIRSGPGTNYKKIGGLTYGKTFTATKQSGNWVYGPALNGWVCVKNGSTIYLKEV